MAIFQLYSTRQRKLSGQVSDVYQYESIPQNLRVQASQIIEEIMGSGNTYFRPETSVYAWIHRTVCREYGVNSLSPECETDSHAIFSFLNDTNDYEKCLDVIEICFKSVDTTLRNQPEKFKLDDEQIDSAIEELNYRFKEAGVGYQFEGGEIIRVDSQFVHSEAVKPILQILGSNPSYEGANDEFLSAHEHFRHQHYKECLNDCLKSFESLMKAIHVKRGWDLKQNDTAKKLINGCLTNGLIPEYMQYEFSSLRSLLESGIPTIRNKEGGHGQGHEVITVPDHLASYALHLTASTLLFLAKCDEKL